MKLVQEMKDVAKAWPFFIVTFIAFFSLFALSGKFGSRPDALEPYAACVQRMTGLDEWDVRFVYDTMASGTIADPSYLNATVWVDTVTLAEMSREEIREFVRHELAHIFLWETAEALWEADETRAERVEEATATRWARWPLWAEVCR